MIFFTADQHFHHQNIIKYCNRPFVWFNQMDDALIDNFNKVVTNDDIVYHLGDFSFGDNVEYYLRMEKSIILSLETMTGKIE
jgi:calcineurin-like phosphoesterase family protein